jgi:branched-chain amino acid aminotransferase
MDRVVYLNGQLVAKSEAKISVFDHGLLYGDGVFEGIRIYEGRAFRLDKHIRRLYHSGQAIRLAIPLAPPEMSRAIAETMAANSDLRNGYIRVAVTRGEGDLGLNPFQCRQPQVIIIADTIALYPEENYEQGLHIITASVIRTPPNSLSPRIKSLNYLNNILAKIEGLDAGVPEAIMLNHQGLVAEATGDNVFIVRGGEVLTPPTADGILEGVTREEVLDICGAQGRPSHEVSITRYDLYTADECFLTGTAAEVVPVTQIDHRIIGDGVIGPVTREFLAEFRQRTKG